MKRALFLLGIIVILGAILRFFYLGKTPVSLEWDEVALGYDAYSIIHTGKDQFGTFLPNNFRSLDDWKPPLYVYSAIPSIALLGLTDFATRFPSALFGTGAVFLVFFLVKEIFKDRSESERNYLALLSSLFLAISPWHLQFSRASFETNLSVTVTISAVLCFLKGIGGNKKLFLLSSLLFGLALFSYHSTRVVTPLLLISLFFLFRKKLPTRNILFVFGGIYLLFWIFFFPIAINRDAQIRFIVTNDLKVEENQTKSAFSILSDDQLGKDPGFAGRIFHNRRISILTYQNVLTMIKNYSSHFSPEFLFFKGDAPLHHAPGFGMMYFFDAVLLFVGIFVYFKYFRNRESMILPIWMLIAPFPAAVTWQAPHSVRAEIILPSLQIMCALGLFGLLKMLKNEWSVLLNLGKLVFVALFVFGIGIYLHQYYIHTNIELSRNWIYGRKEAVEFTEAEKDKYDKVLVSLRVDMPYIFWLYYTKYSPEKYLSQGGTVSGGFADERNKFDKYEFRNFRYHEFSPTEKILLVDTPENFPPDAQILKTIYYLDGSPALAIAQTRRM